MAKFQNDEEVIYLYRLENIGDTQRFCTQLSAHQRNENIAADFIIEDNVLKMYDYRLGVFGFYECNIPYKIIE